MNKFFQTWGGVAGTVCSLLLLASPLLTSAQIGSDATHQGGTGITPTHQSGTGNTPTNQSGTGNFPTHQSGTGQYTSQGPTGSVTLTNPLGGINSICALITKLLQAAIVIGIPIAVLFVVWAGFKFILAQGKMAELQTARRNFLNVVIGIAIFFGASLIAQVILNTLKAFGVSGLNSC